MIIRYNDELICPLGDNNVKRLVFVICLSQNKKNTTQIYIDEPSEDDKTKPHVIILSFPKYCRYRAMMKRLEGVENMYLKYKIVNALGGFYVTNPNTRVLFCRDTFDYPELEGHELLCNHLAPKLKGRPRGKRKKRSISPGSESNESESSITNHYTRSSDRANGARSDSPVATRRSTRCHENNENKQFMKVLTAFMKSKHIPMGRIPSLGYKELNLYEFFTKVQKLGGYDCVTANRFWKCIFDDMTGHLNSTSAATIIRRHYERFLLAYERHLKGEEYKPLPVSERRRLKSKRSSTASSCASDPESSNDTITPSTSRSGSTPPTTNETKESPTGKTSSLRSIRVKTERQKDKQNSVSDKTSVTPVGNPEHGVKVETEDVKPDEAVIIKLEDFKSETKTEPKPKHEIGEECKDGSFKTELKTEVKDEPDTTLSDPTIVTASIPEGTKTDISIPDKNAEPLTTAVAPVAITLIPDKILSPVEGKENIPVIKTGDTASATTNVTPEIINVPYKAKTPDVKTDNENTYKIMPNKFINDVKKIKLDILKEGGLEVTPVRAGLISPAVKDIRPSVIQPITHTNTSKPDMPPPLVSKILPARNSIFIVPPSINITQIKSSTSTSIKPAIKSDTISFANGAVPPKVVQSRSIYSYSEKTVYGNPKDGLPSAMVPQTPRFIRQGGDPMDLSITSPQKPVVEIMRIPQSSTSNAHVSYNKESVTKNLYKIPSNTVLDGRKLGSNLEITVVGPKASTNSSKPASYVPKAPTHRRASHEPYASKIARLKADENGSKHSKYNIPPGHKNNGELNIPSLFEKNNIPVNINKNEPRHTPPVQKTPLVSPLPPTMPNYLSHFNGPETANAMNQYLPLLEPLYYQHLQAAAFQNVYSGFPGMASSLPLQLPIPTPEQLKFYAEFMAHSGMNIFPNPTNGQSSMNNKKP
ncbi:hypothetical protein GWI33_022895 [Rhynchophorus ferrugineus]|uniref:ARID domain-containing protein n=1 Tax=Rhynchophorus ferrugineus TaxID=354439 RepID=A0A834MIR2_RHYFE|nr:hypothetical protein GWI33_022895 [Rhynchophorus ferrugineus]